MAARGLGKGLDALIPAGDKKITKEENTKGAETIVKITKVEPNRSQPRKNFDEDTGAGRFYQTVWAFAAYSGTGQRRIL